MNKKYPTFLSNLALTADLNSMPVPLDMVTSEKFKLNFEVARTKAGLKIEKHKNSRHPRSEKAEMQPNCVCPTKPSVDIDRKVSPHPNYLNHRSIKQ